MNTNTEETKSAAAQSDDGDTPDEETEGASEKKEGTGAIPSGNVKVPSWITEAESEATAAAKDSDAVGAEDLEAAPVIDWSPATAEEDVDQTREGLEKLAAPLSALPAADTPMDIPSPVLKLEAEPLPLVESCDTDESLVLSRVTEARRQQLMATIDKIYDSIPDVSHGIDKDTMEAIIKLLKTARHTLIENPRDYDTAEYYTYRSQALMAQWAAFRRMSHGPVGWGLFFYEIVISVLIFFGFLLGKPWGENWISMGVPGWAASVWPALMAGAAGGVCSALWALREHIAIKRDFHDLHAVWYLSSPLIGGLLSVVLFFALHSGMLAIGGQELPAVDPNVAWDISTPNFLLWALAWLVGFRQNVALNLFDRLISVFQPAKGGE